MARRTAILAFSLLALGCGGRSEADIARGRQALTAALDGWKADQPPAKLKSLADPVEFSDELRAAYMLTDYTIGKVDASDKDVIRYTVTLKLKDKKGKESERGVTYAVALKSPVVISRDPYY